jgi:hypothetical protein
MTLPLKNTILALCAAAACVTTPVTMAQVGSSRPLSARGSLDAVTILPSTQPASQQPPISGNAIPAGHPQVQGEANGMNASAIPGHPAKMQAPKFGALRVKVSQGTKDAVPVGKDSVKVELFARGVVLKTLRATLDESGIIELHDLPLETPFQPVVTVTHAGAEEQMVGPPMHTYQPAVELDMKVYETTAEKPAWTIGIRQILAEPVTVNGGTVLRITEMIGGYNPLDRAWTGESTADGTQTFALALPADAQNVQFGPGLAEAGGKVVAGKAVRGKTMLPGINQYVLAYDIPVTDGKASISFVAPADTTLFAMYVPGDAKIDSHTGLDIGKAGGTNGEAARQLLKAKTVKAGTVLTVDLSAVKVPPPPTTQATEPPDQTTDLHLPRPSPSKTESK